MKANGPLFAMFPKSAPVSEEDTLLYNSPNENHVTTSPTRVFPDLEQILSNNTNADTGACASGPIAPPVSIPTKECFSEFLPTSDYAPAALHFRLTARDLHPGGGGYSSADLTLTLADNAGPFLVTSPNSGVTYPGGSVQTVTWDKANTDIPPTSASNVKISLSTDGGLTYPHVLAASTANDGSRGRDDPERADDYRSREDRGRRQRLLRRLERELHDHQGAASAATTAPHLRHLLHHRRRHHLRLHHHHRLRHLHRHHHRGCAAECRT